MTFYKNRYVLCFFLFLLMLLDGQLSFLVSSIFSYHLTISSHLLLLALLYFYQDKQQIFIWLTALLLGFLFDIYYLDRVGFVMFLLPFLLSIASKITPFVTTTFQTVILYMIVLFLFEFIGEICAILLGMTQHSIAYFVTYSFAPTLLYNIFMYFICHKLFRRVFLRA